jgi:hypothetical protein
VVCGTPCRCVHADRSGVGWDARRPYSCAVRVLWHSAYDTTEAASGQSPRPTRPDGYTTGPEPEAVRPQGRPARVAGPRSGLFIIDVGPICACRALHAPAANAMHAFHDLRMLRAESQNARRKEERGNSAIHDQTRTQCRAFWGSARRVASQRGACGDREQALSSRSSRTTSCPKTARRHAAAPPHRALGRTKVRRDRRVARSVGVWPIGG